MGEAFAWGLFSASSVLMGALVALRFDVGRRPLGLIMAFGSGVLISAVAYELVVTPSGSGTVGIGLAAGALSFFLGDLYIDHLGGAHRKSAEPPAEEEGSPTAIALGTVLDGIPESIVLGLTLLSGDGVSVAMVAAIFISNFPEGLASTAGLVKSGWPPRRVLTMWSVIAVVCAVAAAAGYGLLEGAPEDLVAGIQAFAAGALLTMLADSMMPTAFTFGGRVTGLFTTAGFALAFAIASLE